MSIRIPLLGEHTALQTPSGIQSRCHSATPCILKDLMNKIKRALPGLVAVVAGDEQEEQPSPCVMGVADAM
jgi:hypothetical protein